MFNNRNNYRRADAQQTEFGFIFDMDGTIVDDVAYHVLAWQKLLTERGMKKELAEIERERFGTNKEIAVRLFGNHLSEQEATALGKRQEELFRELYRPNMKLIDGLKKFLDDARSANIPMALACDASVDSIHWIMECLYLNSYFKAVVGAEDFERGKPHPDVLIKAALRLGLMPEDCIAFDDSDSGLEAAMRAGIKVFAVRTKPGDKPPAQANIVQTISDYRSIRPQLASTYSKTIQLT